METTAATITTTSTNRSNASGKANCTKIYVGKERHGANFSWIEIHRFHLSS
jgi:hypothetical protein